MNGRRVAHFLPAHVFLEEADDALDVLDHGGAGAHALERTQIAEGEGGDGIDAPDEGGGLAVDGDGPHLVEGRKA